MNAKSAKAQNLVAYIKTKFELLMSAGARLVRPRKLKLKP